MLPRGRFFIPIDRLFIYLLRLLYTSKKKQDNVIEFKKELIQFLDIDRVDLFSSCRIAFYNLLVALDLPKGSEIYLSPITIPDIVNAIIIAGHRPAFIDIDRETHTIELSSLENGKTSKGKLVLVTYLSGLTFDIAPIRDFCNKNHLILVKDISQVLGASYNNIKIGKSADYSIFSLSIGKNISTLVGGGLCQHKESKLLLESENKATPSKRYLLSLLLENIKIELLTCRPIFNFFTGPLLQLYAKFFPNQYVEIHNKNIVTHFDENDIFFDDIPVLRTHFPLQMKFILNSWMAKIGQDCLKQWHSSLSAREKLRLVFINEASAITKSHIPRQFFSKNIYSLRVPLHIEDRKKFQLFCMRSGIDTGGYGLNLCSSEKAFLQFKQLLNNSEYIKKHCVFINLHEKSTLNEIKHSANVVNSYFEES
jgi:perosamine synthetase